MSATDERAVADTDGTMSGPAREGPTPKVAAELLRVLQGVLTGVQGVVGEGASQALLRYGAFEEGKRLAAEQGQTELTAILAHVDRLFDQTSHADHQGSGNVRIEVHGSEILAADNPLIDTIYLGLYEGVLNGTFQAGFKGTILERTAGHATLLFAADGP